MKNLTIILAAVVVIMFAGCRIVRPGSMITDKTEIKHRDTSTLVKGAKVTALPNYDSVFKALALVFARTGRVDTLYYPDPSGRAVLKYYYTPKGLEGSCTAKDSMLKWQTLEINRLRNTSTTEVVNHVPDWAKYVIAAMGMALLILGAFVLLITLLFVKKHV